MIVSFLVFKKKIEDEKQKFVNLSVKTEHNGN